MTKQPPNAPTELRVDMVRCVAHGICAHVLAERIILDPWGFPIVDDEPLATRSDLRRAKRAARACPRRALLLVQQPPATAPPPATMVS